MGYPSRTDAVRILAALIRDVPGSEAVDTTAAVAAPLKLTNGSDIREVVCHAVLASDGGRVSSAMLLAEVGSGRYQAVPPAEMYLCADLATRICTVERTELRRGLSRPGYVRVFRFAALFR
jgi:cell division protease FtsH